MSASRLRNRRRWRFVFALVCCLIFDFKSLFDHFFTARNRRGGQDWFRLDGREIGFVGAIDGESISFRDDLGDVLAVRLLGVASFNADWERRSARRVNSLLERRKLILHLEPTQTRDSRDRLLAYVFTDDSRPIGPELVGEGLALDDRRMFFAFHGAVDQAESLAKRKHLGFWGTPGSRDMPAWREAWFEQRKNLVVDAF